MRDHQDYGFHDLRFCARPIPLSLAMTIDSDDG